MSMNSAFSLASGLIQGSFLGIFYFGGLWLTLKRLHQCRQPTLLSLSSFSARTLICAIGFYLIIGKGIVTLLFSLVGFVLIKIILIHKISSFDKGGLLK